MFKVRSLVFVASVVFLGACSKSNSSPAAAAESAAVSQAPQLQQITSVSDPLPANLAPALAANARLEIGVKQHSIDEGLTSAVVTPTPVPTAAPQAAAANAAPKSIICRVGTPSYGQGGAFLAANSCGSFFFQPANCVRGDNGGVNAYPDARYHGTVSSFFLEGGMNSFRIMQPSAAALPGAFLCCGGGNGTGACYGLYFETRFDRMVD